jgi:hypothetical protein
LKLGRKVFKEMEKNYHTVFQPYDEFEKLVPKGNYLDRNDPALFSKYHDDILYYETTLTALTNIVATQKKSTDSLIQLIKTNYHLDD